MKRTLPIAEILASLLAVISMFGGCKRKNPHDALARDIAGQLSKVLHVAVDAISCPADGKVRSGFTCAGTLSGGASFAVAVTGKDSAGKPRWKPLGGLNYEYQIALGLAEATHAQTAAVVCPENGDLEAGFHCEVTLADGFVTTVAVSEAEDGRSFVWRAGEILMLDIVEGQIARDLQAKGREVIVDCGQEVQKSTPGHMFDCAIRVAGGDDCTAWVSVVDAEGRVQYRIMPGPRDKGACSAGGTE